MLGNTIVQCAKEAASWPKIEMDDEKDKAELRDLIRKVATEMTDVKYKAEDLDLPEVVKLLEVAWGCLGSAFDEAR